MPGRFLCLNKAVEPELIAKVALLVLRLELGNFSFIRPIVPFGLRNATLDKVLLVIAQYLQFP
jgi:hypothetical protein